MTFACGIPPERNFLAAHLTLFHHLPPHQRLVIDTLSDWALRQKSFLLEVVGVVFTGKGVAYKIESSPLVKEHKALQKTFQSWLTPQDKQGLWPHITVQNKVEPAVAKALQAELAAAFQPFTITATGMIVWRYRGGPWEHEQSLIFKSDA
jgi:hypothetical protein